MLTLLQIIYPGPGWLVLGIELVVECLVWVTVPSLAFNCLEAKMPVWFQPSLAYSMGKPKRRQNSSFATWWGEAFVLGINYCCCTIAVGDVLQEPLRLSLSRVDTCSRSHITTARAGALPCEDSLSLYTVASWRQLVRRLFISIGFG